HFFFFQAEDGIRDKLVTGVQTCALPISPLFMSGSVQSTEEAPPQVKSGAFETMEAGRTCDISAACHWAVNMAASGQHGKMWGHEIGRASCRERGETAAGGEERQEETVET